MELALKAKLERDPDMSEQTRDEELHRWRDPGENLQLFTALRRVTKQPDPLQVIANVPPNAAVSLRDRPGLWVTLRNEDIERQPVRSWRSPNSGCWRIHVWNEKGEQLPSPRNDGPIVRGGIYTIQDLQFGEEYTTLLGLWNHASIREPGMYRMQVLYSYFDNIAEIESDAELENLIIFKSDPFFLQVE